MWEFSGKYLHKSEKTEKLVFFFLPLFTNAGKYSAEIEENEFLICLLFCYNAGFFLADMQESCRNDPLVLLVTNVTFPSLQSHPFAQYHAKHIITFSVKQSSESRSF